MVDVMAKAKEALGYYTEKLKGVEPKREHVALLALLEGYATGQIDKGSALLGRLLITVFDDTPLEKSPPDNKEREILQSMFGKGFCNESQYLEKNQNIRASDWRIRH